MRAVAPRGVAAGGRGLGRERGGGPGGGAGAVAVHQICDLREGT